MRNAISPIKMMIVAVLFSVGLSGAAQAKTLYLKCGAVEAVIEKNKNGDYSLKFNNFFWEKIITNDTSIKITSENFENKNYIFISRFDLSYLRINSLSSEKGYCKEGRKF